MPFAYYRRLSRAQQRVYRRSDEISVIRLPGAGEARPLVDSLADALAKGDRLAAEAAASRLLVRITASLGMPPLRAQVLAVRPSRSWGELHGLYSPGGNGRPSRATVWMRTAQRRQVVKFRTFLRTLVHELCHHLDYELHHLPDSLHTEGFYRRESSLLRQLLGEASSGEVPGHV